MTIDAGSADLLGLFTEHPTLTRAKVGEITGWARVTVNSRVEQLLTHELIAEQDSTVGTRGRPAARFAFQPNRGSLLIADIGASAMRLACCDLAGRVLERTDLDIVIGAGPEPVLNAVVTGLKRLAKKKGIPVPWGVAASVPGPVEWPSGRIVDPPIMTGWDDFPLSQYLAREFHVSAFVDNDVNAMAWGEHRAHPTNDDMVYVKVGTGVGVGIVAGGRIIRGSTGAAGDLGHTWADLVDQRQDRPLCRCGKKGCVEAYVGGWAMARDLTEITGKQHSVSDVVNRIKSGDPRAVSLVRQAGRILGASLTQVMSLLNPAVIIVGGQIAVADEHLLTGIRELIARRSLPITARNLVLKTDELGDGAGIIGLASGIGHKVLTDPTSLTALALRHPPDRPARAAS